MLSVSEKVRTKVDLLYKPADFNKRGSEMEKRETL